MDNLRETVRVATSKPVQRAAVNTALLVSGAATLFCMAAVVTGIFFYNYVPDHKITIPVYLQYGSGPNPYAVLSLSRPQMIKTQQEYDVSVLLSMPRSPANVERGNFMVMLQLLGGEANSKLEADARVFANAHDHFGTNKVLFTSRRPALVPYVDPVVSLSKRLLLLLYYMLFPGSQTCTMSVTLAEHLAFPKSSGVPASAYVEIEAGQDIHIYRAALIMTAQLRGLRSLMFHYRLLSYVAFTLLFWACEVLFMGLAWAAWAAATGPGNPRADKGRGSIAGDAFKEERELEDSSDHPLTFPTYGRQRPLRYEPEIKEEDDETRIRHILDLPVAGAEADDEDEPNVDEDGGQRRYDSGLGTSYSEKGSGSVRRRASRNAME